MCVVIFSTNFSEIYLILRRTEWDMIWNVYLSSCKVHIFLVSLQWNLNFLEIFEKYSNIKCQENPSSRSRVVPRGRTDGLRDMTKLTVAFRHFANASKNTTWARLLIGLSGYRAELSRCWAHSFSWQQGTNLSSKRRHCNIDFKHGPWTKSPKN